MPTIQKISIALPNEMTALIHQAVETGEYASSSEVIREALRAWNYQRALRQKALVELRADIQTGFNTGDAAEAGIETIIAGAKAQRKAKLARPTSNASNHAKA